MNRYTACLNYFKKFKDANILEIGAGFIDIPNNFHYKTTKDFLNIEKESSLEWRTNHWDVIIMNAVIEHLIDPGKALHHVYQLLKIGGIVYIMTPNIAHYANRLKLLRGKFPSTASTNEGLTKYSGGNTDTYDQGHLHYFTFRSLRILMERKGFKTTKYFMPLKAPGLLARIYPELFSELVIIGKK